MSEHSLAAVEYASSFGLLYSSTVYMLYVVEKPPIIPPIDGAHLFSQSPKTGDEAMAELEKFLAHNVRSNVEFIPVVRIGAPAEEIARFATEAGVDLITMAMHGRTGLQHIVMGSVAEKVVRIASVPVLTIKPEPMRETILDREDIEMDLHLGQR